MDALQQNIILHTQQWIKKIVIQLNFCPFAAQPFYKNKILYTVLNSAKRKTVLENLLDTCQLLSANNDFETALIILPNNFEDFNSYLDILALCNKNLKNKELSSTFQLASFHPDYVFDKQDYNQAANFTNRSPYPMLHILKQSSVTWATQHHTNTLAIPMANIQTAHQQGYSTLFALWESCFE